MGVGVREIRAGGFYANEEKGYVREAARVEEDGTVHWRAYFLSTGESAWSGACSLAHLMRWSDREATPDEVGRLRRADAELEEIEAGAELLFGLLGRLPDDVLLAEVRRRGLAP